MEQKVAYFDGDSDEVYGSPRILVDLRGDGGAVSREAVARAMTSLGLAGMCTKKRSMTTVIHLANAYTVDKVKRR
ncbi:IS3 family transposase [Arthrobacter sp. RIT-PI-e]|uniref:IS3 family transposase n=1 Tax=Arthrobacter sp. RIT-PI-e TaxID=1681197 RepID=UPI0009E55461